MTAPLLCSFLAGLSLGAGRRNQTHAPLEPNPPLPRAASDTSSSSTGSAGAQGSTTSRAIRSAGPQLARLLAIGVEQQHLELAALALVDQPGLVDQRNPCRVTANAGVGSFVSPVSGPPRPRELASRRAAA
jgi:hypothetical protein